MGWNRTPLHDTQWRVRPYWTKQSQALEQDAAAGGRDHRVMRDCGALGRVILRRRYLRVYAELRWQINKKEHSTYLCEVTGDTRAANLIVAWQLVHDRGHGHGSCKTHSRPSWIGSKAALSATAVLTTEDIPTGCQGCRSVISLGAASTRFAHVPSGCCEMANSPTSPE